MTDPKTLAECLDAARTGEEFGEVLSALFGRLAQARDDEPQSER